MIDKTTIWAWFCDKPHGGYLFHGNPNGDLPQYHMGDISNLLNAEDLVWMNTHFGLKWRYPMRRWNKKFPQFRVKPRRITVEMRPCAKRNIDVGTIEDQAERFGRFCDGCDRKWCGPQAKALHLEKCALRWLQMPYKKGDNDADK